MPASDRYNSVMLAHPISYILILWTEHTRKNQSRYKWCRGRDLDPWTARD